MKITIKKKIFSFNFPAGTSRGVLHQKTSWFIIISDKQNAIKAIGECSVIEGLSIDNINNIENVLSEVAIKLNDSDPAQLIHNYHNYPSVQFALDMLSRQLTNNKIMECYDGDFLKGKTGIPINGLIWMGNPDFMLSQIKEKIEKGADCLKLKVGANKTSDELDILRRIRSQYSNDTLEIRLDANGAFEAKNAPSIIEKYAHYKIHSIEQPIKQGQIEAMKKICRLTSIPVALDEELIGIHSQKEMHTLLDEIHPQFIILKPSLLGGFLQTDKWINEAASNGIDWWITSALESNIGLAAIAQYTFLHRKHSKQKYHGLGTGQIYKNNILSPLYIDRFKLWWNTKNQKNNWLIT